MATETIEVEFSNDVSELLENLHTAIEEVEGAQTEPAEQIADELESFGFDVVEATPMSPSVSEGSQIVEVYRSRGSKIGRSTLKKVYDETGLMPIAMMAKDHDDGATLRMWFNEPEKIIEGAV